MLFENFIKRPVRLIFENISEIHRTEPYVYSQMIAGRDAARHGEAKNSWLTGTAAGPLSTCPRRSLACSLPTTDFPLIRAVPEGFGDFTLTRRFRVPLTTSMMKNPNNVKKGVCLIWKWNGKQVEGNVVPVEDGKKNIM